MRSLSVGATSLGGGMGTWVGTGVKVAVGCGGPLICVRVGVGVAVKRGVSVGAGVDDATNAWVGETGTRVVGRGVAVIMTVMGGSVARAVGVTPNAMARNGSNSFNVEPIKSAPSVDPKMPSAHKTRMTAATPCHRFQ
ncbi:MAG: hypothetical protein DCC52_05905 [Chloroflexi bacterium]|nr:MAG: hypothetical protein DCC52_05905 [Chloroflexota bacterium]